MKKASSTNLLMIISLSIILLCFSSSVFSQSANKNSLKFSRVWEPNEKAASVLMPEGWSIEGGVIRLQPNQGGEANAYLSKVDVALKSDSQGTKMIHWCPSWIYIGGAGMGGQIMYGMPVFGPATPTEYLTNVVFPKEHPNAINFRITDTKKLDRTLSIYSQKLSAYASQVMLDGDIITVEYNENGIRYKEKMMTIIIYNQNMMGVIWTNTDTKTIRAPYDEFDSVEAVFDIISNSVEMNPQWEANENALRQRIAAASMASRQSNLQYQGSSNEIGDMIMGGWQKRQASSDAVYDKWNLNYNECQNYMNPYTGDKEIGSSLWDQRYINSQGDVLYSDDPNFDPNVEFNTTDWKLTKPE
jgi:hypothetical protein